MCYQAATFGRDYGDWVAGEAQCGHYRHEGAKSDADDSWGGKRDGGEGGGSYIAYTLEPKDKLADYLSSHGILL